MKMILCGTMSRFLGDEGILYTREHYRLDQERSGKQRANYVLLGHSINSVTWEMCAFKVVFLKRF